jgi:hypothetical protein
MPTIFTGGPARVTVTEHGGTPIGAIVAALVLGLISAFIARYVLVIEEVLWTALAGMLTASTAGAVFVARRVLRDRGQLYRPGRQRPAALPFQPVRVISVTTCQAPVSRGPVLALEAPKPDLGRTAWTALETASSNVLASRDSRTAATGQDGGQPR